MKLILLAFALSSFCHANTIVLNPQEVPRNKLSGALSMLLPGAVMIGREMLEWTRKTLDEKMHRFWERVRRNTSPESEKGRGTSTGRSNTPPQLPQPVPSPFPTTDPSYSIETIYFDNGDVYQGQIKNGQPWGQGSMSYANGTRYEGGWRDGLYEGKGTVFFAPHRLVISETSLWRDNEVISLISRTLAPGVRVLPQGYYLGQLNAAGQPDTAAIDGGEEQPAILETLQGFRYRGEFANGLRFGFGVQERPDGSWYEGQWAYDQMHGRGTLSFPNGTRIKGNWQEGQINFAAVYYANGHKYVGQLNRGLQAHGLGVMYFPDGSRIPSTWREGFAEQGHRPMPFTRSRPVFRPSCPNSSAASGHSR